MIPTASTAAADYARAVRAALADLPSEQAHAIVDGLDEHLAEIAADGTAERWTSATGGRSGRESVSASCSPCLRSS